MGKKEGKGKKCLTHLQIGLTEEKSEIQVNMMRGTCDVLKNLLTDSVRRTCIFFSLLLGG